MSSVVKVGSALYLKVGEKLERADLDELNAIQSQFERSSDSSFVFDLSSLQDATNPAVKILATIQAAARKKGKVYVLTPENTMREKLLESKAINVSEVYETRVLLGQAMKEKVKGNMPV